MLPSLLAGGGDQLALPAFHLAFSQNGVQTHGCFVHNVKLEDWVEEGVLSMTEAVLKPRLTPQGLAICSGHR